MTTDWTSPATLRAPGAIRLGSGAVTVVGSVLHSFVGAQKVLVCTDSYLASATQVTSVTRSLRDAGHEVVVLDMARPELPLPAVEQAIIAARTIAPGAIVGVGGGSCLDLAKLVSLGLAYDSPLSTFYGENAVPGPTGPLIAVPTTGGTGSEVTPVAVLSDPSRALKVGISSPWLIPDIAICDPDLAAGAPSTVTAHAGIDALAHAIEAYTAVERSDWADIGKRVSVGRGSLTGAFALQAITEISRSLLGAINDRARGRAGMQAGSMLAGLAFGTAGVGAAHALQYPLGARTHTPHGLGVGLLLPFVMRFNLPAVGDRLAEVGGALGVGTDSEAAIIKVRELSLEAGLPFSLRELDLGSGDLATIAANGVGITRLIDNNPRRMTAADAEALLEAAWYGDLDMIELPVD